MKILMTAFDPFGGETVNASQEALTKLTPPPGVELVRMILPTVYGLAGEIIKNKIEEIKPDVVICLGQAAGRNVVTPERVAINIRDASIPDNAGFQPCDEPVIPNGPAALFSTLPIRKMIDAAKDRGLPAAISNSAGTFVCNDLMYSLLFLLEENFPEIKGGFIHVPACSASENGPALQTMPIEEIVRVLETMLDALIKE